ncbi:hypothetical protein [Enterococcus cecorum]|uniref:hypothetical protein n=1 Tax=Enterococcus cecorum TaxID=44008 RepID=UPI000DEB16F2|nr:hypothetical protein [Enterococcus cecorum]RBR28414.1 hypothetical protein EB08_01620 [Enterococcus cecorum]RBR35142.1 hypothetical protein EB31_01633 [Enterococcus cecorum]
MCDLTHKKNESQHSKQINKYKEKIKATQSNLLENECSNLASVYGKIKVQSFAKEKCRVLH